MGEHNRVWSLDLQRARQVLRQEGFHELVRKAARKTGKALGLTGVRSSYSHWIARYDTPTAASRQAVIADIARLPVRPTISLIVPVSIGAEHGLLPTLRSVITQLYPHWELCLGLDRPLPLRIDEELRGLEASGRVRIARLARSGRWSDNANAALAVATGEFVVLLDAGDVLAERALYALSRELAEHPDCDLVFSDEDMIDDGSRRKNPWFKSDWNPALMQVCNAFGRLGAYRRALVARVGGFRADCVNTVEHDLVLRCAGATEDKRIRHIPQVLYHRGAAAHAERGKPVAGSATPAPHRIVHALNGNAVRMAATDPASWPRPALPAPRPRVSVIVATTGRPDIAERCFTSLLQGTSYENFEVLVLVNRSAPLDRAQVDLFRRLAQAARVRIVEYSLKTFNYSSVNNLGARQATGDVLCFLNDDTEILSPDWLETLVSRVSLPKVAAAGPLLYYPDGTIQHAGVVLGLGGIANHACIGEPRGSQGYFGRACLEQDVSCVTAACIAIRTKIFRELKGFDETMPLAYNDVDLCLRVRTAGWRIIWTPAAELVHRESASFGRHDHGPWALQYERDARVMRDRWSAWLEHDPFYNPNLSLDSQYKLAFPPRAAGRTAVSAVAPASSTMRSPNHYSPGSDICQVSDALAPENASS